LGPKGPKKGMAEDHSLDVKHPAGLEIAGVK
jgi:hypothetical protein